MRYRVWAFGYLLPLGPLIGTATAMDPVGGQTCQSKNCDVIANILMGIGQPFYDALQIDMQGAPQGTTARRNVAATAIAYHPDYAKPPTRVVHWVSAEASSPPAPQLATRRYERRFATTGLRLAWRCTDARRWMPDACRPTNIQNDLRLLSSTRPAATRLARQTPAILSPTPSRRLPNDLQPHGEFHLAFSTASRKLRSRSNPIRLAKARYSAVPP